MSIPSAYKIVISDCHLSAGRYYEGKLNPHEDFHYDEDLVGLIRHFSTDQYGEIAGIPVEVELVIDGDFLDFLNVPIRGEFDDAVTEDLAVAKVHAILAGHREVFKAIRDFASLEGKSVTYLVGNHDADLFFDRVREAVTRDWDPEGRFPSEKVKLVVDREFLHYPECGLEIHHGNQFDGGSELDFSHPTRGRYHGKPLLNLPWSSIYVLKIVNRLKWLRPQFDKIRPAKVFVLFGLVLDPWFTLRFAFLTMFYFLKTRIFGSERASKRRGFHFFKDLWNHFREESAFFQDLERPARKLLDDREKTRVVVFGHTHRPMHRVYPDGKEYVNTGTWVRMIDLDWKTLGQGARRTFAWIEVRGPKVRCELRHWVGDASPHETFIA